VSFRQGCTEEKKGWSETEKREIGSDRLKDAQKRRKGGAKQKRGRSDRIVSGLLEAGQGFFVVPGHPVSGGLFRLGVMAL
jgi:hypothetical protein